MNKYVYEEIANRIPTTLPLKCRKDGDFYQVLGFSNTEILSINNTAYEILKRCDGKSTLLQIHEELMQVYNDIDSDRLLKDIVHTIVNFEHLNWITFCRDFANA